MTGESKQSCAQCRFGTAIGRVGKSDLVRCGWVDRTEDEAGDRMPEWAHELLRDHSHAVGNDDRGETCPAFEEAP
jgi:hypothetical protein